MFALPFGRAGKRKLTMEHSGPSLRLQNDNVDYVGEQLDEFLGPEYLSYRRGEGNRMFAYLEGHEVFDLLNGIFGWRSWKSQVVSTEVDYANMSNGGKWNVGLACTVRVTVVGKGKEGEAWREDVGYGTIENAPGQGKAMEKCRKEATTDGMKRAARQFGKATGGCLYNKEYLDRVKKVKGPMSRIDFVETKLRRKAMNRRDRFLAVRDDKQQVKETVGGERVGSPVNDEKEFEEDGWDGRAIEEMFESDELVTI